MIHLAASFPCVFATKLTSFLSLDHKGTANMVNSIKVNFIFAKVAIKQLKMMEDAKKKKKIKQENYPKIN